MYKIVVAMDCIVVWLTVGAENNSPSAVAYDHAESDMDTNNSQLSSDQQGDDCLVDQSSSIQLSPPLKLISGQVLSFYSTLLKSIILPMRGFPNSLTQCSGWLIHCSHS